MDLVSQHYWDSSYQNLSYHVASDEITKWIDKHSYLFSKIGKLFEFGCYPGRYLSFLGKKGWTVNGLDLTPGIEKGFSSWLHSEKIKTGIIRKADALAYAAETHDRYDLVCSFGFIEHFENFGRVIELHDRLLADGGWLMISTPNFRGKLQKLLHQNLNSESLKIHYLPSMRPSIWKAQLERFGYTVSYSGYFGGFDFWYDEANRNGLQKLTLKTIRKLTPHLKRLPNNELYSPYCGIIAQKRKL